MTLLFNGCNVTVEAAFDDSLFAASPSWTDITSYVRGKEGISLRRSGRTSEIDAFQPGSAEIVCNLRNRALDPTYGPASVSFDGSGSDYWSCGDVAGFSGATTLDVRFAISADDWTPGGTQTIIGQWGAAGQRSWRVILNTTGTLSLFTSNDGTATSSAGSGVQFCAVNGQAVAGRVTWTTAGTTSFYIKRSTKDRVVQDARSHDGWILVGDGAGGTTSLFNSTANVVVAALADGTNAFDGTVYYASAATSMDDDTPLVAFWPKDAASSASTSWTGSVDGLSWVGSGTYVVDPQGLYYGRLLPGTPIRVSAVFNAVTYRLWYGYLRRAVLSYPSSGKDAIVRLQASDALAWLSDRDAPDTPFGLAIDAIGPTRLGTYWPLHEPLSTLEASDTEGTSTGQWPAYMDAGGQSQPDTNAPTRLLNDIALRATGETHLGTVGIAGLSYQPAIAFWVHLPDEDATFRVSAEISPGWIVTFNYKYGGISYAQESAVYDVGWYFEPAMAPGTHFVMVIADSFTRAIYVDGVLSSMSSGIDIGPILDTSGYGNLLVVGVGATVSDVLVGNPDYMTDIHTWGRVDESCGDRMERLLAAAGVPAGLMDMTTETGHFVGRTTAGGTYGELCRQVNAAAAGRLSVTGAGLIKFRTRQDAITESASITSQGTFSDTFVDIALQPADISDVINTAIVALPNGTAGSYSDAESVALYGPQPASFSAPCRSPNDARSLAKHYVQLRNHPHTRVSSVSLKPRNSNLASTLFPHVLGRDIGDRITVTRNVTGTLKPSSTTTAVSAQVMIDGITHRITEDDWVTTWTTTPAPLTASEAGYLTPDDAVLGNVDAGLGAAP